MAVVINDKVGRLCVNRVQDVIAIQDALNRVPVEQGGTPHKKKLPLSGNCGADTVEAIQLFQLKQFGWPGADGKIFPQGETHVRLNQILGNGTVFIPQPKIEDLTNAFLFRFYTGGSRPGALSPDRFINAFEDVWIEVEDAANQKVATYRVPQIIRISPQPHEQFSLSEPIYWTGKPISVDSFEDAAFQYSTRSTAIQWTPGDTALDFNAMSIKLHPDKSKSKQQDYPYLKVTIWEPHYEAMTSEKKGHHYFKFIIGRMQRVK